MRMGEEGIRKGESKTNKASNPKKKLCFTRWSSMPHTRAMTRTRRAESITTTNLIIGGVKAECAQNIMDSVNHAINQEEISTTLHAIRLADRPSGSGSG
ncbi:unnamed protein product [Sphenostylis stenocarpa]|uniref:Uncharacterized protein n=1 Tax=Sphenostylis stenocarpa TaxID=92480 RepID=A0AA86SJJ8_9FABA|nr:unnamed protein product [Sphenostylis stenocarpa]